MTSAGAGKAATRNNEDAALRKRIQQISRQVSSIIGAEFFQGIAKHLAVSLDADCVIVAEFLGGHMERCRSVGAWSDGAPASFEYELAGSAMARLAIGGPCQWRIHVRKRFPSDPVLSKLGAEGCIGVPLLANGRHPVGGLMAIYRRSVPDLHLPRAVLEVFAGRAAAELQREIEEQKLRESEQRYRAFITQNADPMWRIEFERPVAVDLPEEEQFERIYKYGYLAECNDALVRWLGAAGPEQLIGSRIDELAPAADPAHREAMLDSIRSRYTQTSVEANRVDKSGNLRCMLRSQWGIIEDGQLKRIWGSNRDITALRHTQIALDASEQRMADLVESARLVVIFLDSDGSIQFCNNYVFAVTGWPPAELIGKDWLETLISPAERSRVSAELTRNTPDHPVHFESDLLTRAGVLHVEWDSTVLRNIEGAPVSRALVGRNVTEQKALQGQVLQAQKLAGIGRLAGGLAHDFNNELTVILGYTSKLLEEVKPSDAAFTSLSNIQRAAARSADLAHRLLAFSRREAYRPRIVDLNSFIETTRGDIEALAGDFVRLRLDFEQDLRHVRLDTTHFHHALLNLAANARDAMPEGGLLTIATSNFDVLPDEPHPAGIPPGEYVVLTVADTGSGMSEEVKNRLFEPFFTTKERGKGTGLGLATVYGIIQQSSGQIRVESELGQGTTFRIFLPHISAPKPAEPLKQVRGLPRGTETVLVIEGPYSRGATAAHALSDLGYTVLRADGPTRALEIAREKPDSIQLLLSPVASQGMPAEVLLSMVKDFQPRIKALFISGADEKVSIARNDSPTAYDFLPRAFSRKVLARKTREVLDRE